MKRTMTSAAVIVASVGILLGGAGTASAQEPYGKYPTKARCEAVGKPLVFVGGQKGYACDSNPSAPSSQRWWLYIW
ncbi:hypothetical protein [Lentzea kentuckyensis]|uniref:hypothetical protein n=1 Tax=Lentzea kentuckyensis TaxID=360086 RepID=UPI00117AF909|nr:hypothetical protein [Lentzea kentuckyensis]